MNHVVKIEANIAGGVDLALGPKTLIIGKSAGGKTTVVRALELALAGGTSDLEGRDWVGDDVRLLSLMAGETGHIEAKATMANGDESRFCKIVGKNASPKGGGGQVLALRHVREQMTGSADKARTFVMKIACGNVVIADVLGRLPAGLHETYNALAGAQSGSPVDVLQAVADHAGTRGRELTREAKGAQKVIDAMTAAGGSPTEAQVAEATQHAAKLAAQLNGARNAQASVARRAPLIKSMQEHEQAVAHWAAEIEKIPEAGPADIEMQQKWAKAQALRTVVEMQQSGGGVECKVCGGKQVAGDLAQRMVAVLAALDGVLAGFAARQEALELRTKMVAKYNHVFMNLKNLQAQFNALPEELELGVDLAGLELEAQAAETFRQNQLANFQAAEKLQRARALGHEATEKADRFKRLATACKIAIGELVQANLDLFIKRVNRYMPKDMEFGVESGKRFRIGLVETRMRDADGNDRRLLHTALSGAEWVAVTTAIGSVVTENAEVALLLPEERAYDPEMLGRIMRGLSKAPAQIVLTSTVKFKGRAPAGWTVIELD